MKDDQKPLLITVEEAGKIIGFKKSTVYEMINSGELRSVRRGRARRVVVESVLQWVKQQGG